MTPLHGLGRMTRAIRACVLLLGAIACDSGITDAQEVANEAASPIASYRSRHFNLNTDLAADRAQTLLERLERHLVHVEKYWGQPLKGRIDFYVADDLSRWPDEAFPNRFGRLVIARIGGATVQFDKGQGARPVPRVAVYASTAPGVARHELVHAYCQQTFGAMGPIWYKEGMAEVVNLGSQHGAGVRCPKGYVDFFRTAKRQTVVQVIESGQFTQKISKSLRDIDSRCKDKQSKEERLRAWRMEDELAVREAQESYRRAWALCHFLCHNPNYRKRFQTLGKSYLLGRSDSFTRAFSPVGRQLHFEFEFFMNRFDVGYDVHRCCWDWKTKFQALRDSRSVASTIRADHGYQASGVHVERGKRYQYRATGAWRTQQDGQPCTADGSLQGDGRLVAVVMNDFALSSEIYLGSAGTFMPPASGKLYLRCKDRWNQLYDNQGQLQVAMKQMP